MKKLFLITFFLIFVKTLIFAQINNVKIKLEDAISHEPLIGATIRLKSNNKSELQQMSMV
jgi:hypothetical protein